MDYLTTSATLLNADNISNLLTVSAIMTALTIGIYEYKSQLWEYITNRRNKWLFITMALLFAVLSYLQSAGYLFGTPLFLITVVFILYVLFCFYSLKPRLFSDFQNPVLRYYEKKLYQGFVLECIDYFRVESHWYLITKQDKQEYQMLRCMYFSELFDYDAALKAIDLLDDSWLYNVERKIIELRRAICLIFLGNMKAALQLLGDPDNNTSQYSMTWFAYSIIFENLGDMDKAYEYMEKAKNIVDSSGNLPNWEKGEIYNNYARVAIIKGNNEEALRYMNLAWSLIKDTKDTRLIHIVGENRVVRMAICGKSRDDCENALEEYRRAIPDDSVKNRIDLNNTAILLYRQLGDDKKVYDLIQNDFLDLISRLDSVQEVHYVASTFIMLMNGSFEHDWFDPYVKSNFELYEKLSLVERLTVFKGYMGIFQQVSFKVLLNLTPYRFLYKTILHYYENNAIREIDEKLLTLESNNVYIYKELMIQKLGILKILEGKEHIKNSKNMYLKLYDELYEKDLRIEAVHVLLILLDECSSPNNMELVDPYMFGRINYSDFINNIPPAPNPLKASDNIHLSYMHLRIPPNFAVIPLQADVIKEHLDTVITEFKTWKQHPAKLDLCIIISHLLVCLGRNDEAKEYLDFYINSGVSSRQFSYWMQNEVFALRHELLKEEVSGILS